MKKIILPIVAAVSSIALHVHAQVGVNTEQPASTFDITAKNATGTTKNVDGLLIPRVDRERAQNMSAVPTSTLIYINSAATGTQTGTAINIDAAGYYYYNGTAWTKLTSAGSNNIYNTDGTLTGNRIVTQGANTLAFTGSAVNAFSVDGTTLSVDAANNRVGIGTNTPTAQLQLGNTTANRKIALYDNSNNDNQFYGFGVNDFLLRYQTDGAGADHGFFSGINATSSKELMRIKGNGNVGIGTSTPQKMFHVTGASQFGNEINVGGTATTAGSPGTAGQILTSAGAGAAPTWTTPAAVTSTNIYNADGTLTGNRIVTQGANTLAFNGTAVNAFSVDGGTLSVDAANDRVGIGKTAPQFLLDLGNQEGKKISLYNDSGSNFWGFGLGNNALDLYTANNKLMTLGTTNLGIGTSTPQKKLHVDGDLQITKELNVGGSGTVAGSAGTAGQILTSAGAGAAPTWTTPAVTTSTNIYNADGTLTGNRTVTQGTNTLAFSGTGNVGLGVANPAQKLSVIDGTNDNQYSGIASFLPANSTQGIGIGWAGIRKIGTQTNSDFNIDAAGTGNIALQTQATGNVGIGTAAPSAKLHVNGTAQFNNEIKVGGAGNAGTAGQILTSSGAGAAPTWTTPAAVTSTNIYNADGTLTGNRIVTQGANTLAFNSTVVNAFSVDGGTLSVDAANDRVGIGTSTPGNKLVVRGTNSQPAAGVPTNNAPLRIDGGTDHGLDIGPFSQSPWGSFINSVQLSNGNGMPLVLNSVGGNVGVGTTAPQKKLHVDGDLQVTKELNVGGTGSTAGSAGTAGQVLTSSGAGAAPTWTTPAVPTSTNIYNADGTLTGNRIVTQGANTLAFSGTGNVGLGVANPAQKLSVIDGTNDNQYSGIASFLPANSTQGIGIGWAGIRKIGTQTNSDFNIDAAGTGNIALQTQATGNVGIGTTTPSAKLHVNGTAQFNNEIKVGGAGNAGTAGQILTSAGAGAAPTWTTPAVAASTNIYNADGTLTGNRIVTQGANTLAFNGTAVNAFSVDGTTLSVDALNNKVGIGTTTPHGQLQFASVLDNRKVVLYESANNDNQYAGFGIGASLLRYQVGETGSDHGFFAGTGATTSNELMRIKGNGNVGIGTSTPNSKLTVTGGYTSSLTAGTPNTSAVTKMEAASGGQKIDFGFLNYSPYAAYISSADANSNGLPLALNTTGGNVGIGTSTPWNTLHVNGSIQLTKELSLGGTANSTGNAGTAGQILTSAGAGAAPTWTTPAVVTSTNIYNADGTLTGNRTVNQGANTLAFTGGGNVGMGTSAPDQKLSVVGGNDATPQSGIASFLPSNTTQGVGIGWSGIQKIGSMTNADLTVDAKGTGNISMQTATGVTGNVGIGTTAPSAKLHVNGTAQFNNEIKVGTAGNAGTTGQVLMSNGTGAAPKWGTIADVTPTSTGSVLVVDGKFIIAQEISVQMTGDFTSTGAAPVAIGNLTNEIIDNENRFNGTASGNSFTVSANGTYQLTMNASLTDVTTDLNPVIGIFDDTANQWVARVNDQYKSTGSPGVPKLQTYTLIVAFPLVTSHTYSFRQATPTGTITVKSHSTAYTTPDNITAPFTQMSLKRLK
ncbi:hypothetical protein JET18_11845 [Chryseobacterium sp. L7]|uniref:Uncharacterized protein n=1 Tax=Chryseobacterium endalhagicum TaxID=2797638 RepID=A0ABS1QGU2_9FLAO|nr:hypothetical protein [Chryseobacterium endalhagicum]MBL1221537.1 hypothetical protein [Chryseobacterium endalhagicum]